MDRESRFRDIFRQRERLVPQQEKQRLLLLAANLMLAGRELVYQAPIPDDEMGGSGKTYYDTSTKEPANLRLLAMDPTSDRRWIPMYEAGFSRVELCYVPERTLRDPKAEGYDRNEDNLLADKFNLVVRNWENDEETRFMMQATMDRVWISNRTEMKKLGVGWLDIAPDDAKTIARALDKAREVIDIELATP